MRKAGIVAAALLTAMPSAAEFRWMDPHPVAVREQAPGGPPGNGVRGTSPAAPDSMMPGTLPHWDVAPDEMLGDTLRRWGERVGVEVHVLTDRRYRLQGGQRFIGTFGDAVHALLDSLSWLPDPPRADITNQNVLLIRHVSAIPAPREPAVLRGE